MSRRRVLLAVALLGASALLGACDAATRSAPDCRAWERLGLVAQSVPTSSYLPCIAATPPGWQSSRLSVHDGGTTFDLTSDRAQGRPVVVALRERCDITAATPIPPRTLGGRSLLRLVTISPRYAGTMFDVFPGGCVTYSFDFVRGPHIALMAELQQSVGFVTRTQLRLELRRRLDVELGP